MAWLLNVPATYYSLGFIYNSLTDCCWWSCRQVLRNQSWVQPLAVGVKCLAQGHSNSFFRLVALGFKPVILRLLAQGSNLEATCHPYIIHPHQTTPQTTQISGFLMSTRKKEKSGIGVFSPPCNRVLFKARILNCYIHFFFFNLEINDIDSSFWSPSRF